MFSRILKKDLKRKRTMNIILLVFIILANMFITSSIKNMMSISSGIDGFLDKADVKDYISLTIGDEGKDRMIKFLDSDKHVNNYRAEECVLLGKSDVYFNNKKTKSTDNLFLSSINKTCVTYFNQDDKEISSVPKGEMYVSDRDMSINKVKKGDTVTVKTPVNEYKFKIRGSVKDAIFGSSMMGCKRFIINNDEFSKIMGESKTKINIMNIDTTNNADFLTGYNQVPVNTFFKCDRDLIKTSYFMNIIISIVLLVLSGFLILISILILRFTINFSLEDDFREIGVMKAIGLKDNSIRMLYIVKYLVITVVGVLIGFAGGIPFGNVLLNSVSSSMVLQSSNSVLISVISSILVFVLIIGFCYIATGKLKKFSPIQAINNGSSGERYSKKGKIKLYTKKKMGSVFFMAINDIMSGFKKYLTIFVIFTLGFAMLNVLQNTVTTLQSKQIYQLVGVGNTDCFLNNDDEISKLETENDRQLVEDTFNKYKTKIKENKLDVKANITFMYNVKINKGNKYGASFALQDLGDFKPSEYNYYKGKAPKLENEVAVTEKTAGYIKAKIGDTIKILTDDEWHEFVITGYYQSMNNMGEGIRFTNKAKVDLKNTMGSMPVGIKYNGDPSNSEITKINDKLKEKFPECKFMTVAKYADKMMGNCSSQIDSVKYLMLAVILIINVLITVLMVKSFITKEKGEIGMLKSIGFSDRALIRWQTLRMGIILLMGLIVGAVISYPIGQFTSAKVFVMMGCKEIHLVFNPLMNFVVYPLILFGVIIISCLITSLTLKGIKASETNNIE